MNTHSQKIYDTIVVGAGISGLFIANLFKKNSIGTFYSRIINQFSMIFNRLGSDGGLFVVIGKKNIKNSIS